MLNYGDVDSSHGYRYIKEAFRAVTKKDNLKLYISEHDFRSSSNVDDSGHILYVFDTRYQKNLENARPIKVEFELSKNVLAGIYGFALVITKKIVSISSDGQRHFDLI